MKDPLAHPKKKFLFLFAAFLGMTTHVILAQVSPEKNYNAFDGQTSLEFIENQGQWQEEFQFRATIGSGTVFLQPDGFVFDFADPEDLKMAHDSLGTEGSTFQIKHHAWKVHFENCNFVIPRGENPMTHYYNYFLGNDPLQWKSQIHPCSRVIYDDLWPGIDLEIIGDGGYFKYQFVVKPHANVKKIKLRIEGIDGLSLVNGRLKMKTSVGEFFDEMPFVYQFENHMEEVLAFYKLCKDTVSFETAPFRDYLPLVIDPVLVANTFVGASPFTSVGSSSAFGADGSMFLSSSCEYLSMPVTLGAYAILPNGELDLGISKFNGNGTELIWCTYLGGSDDDRCTDMVMDVQQQVWIATYTRSSDFPLSNGSYDSTLGGISDATITCLSASGTALVASTYFGGGNGDGACSPIYNFSATNGSFSQYLSSIVFSDAGSVILGTTSVSTDLPFTTLIGEDMFEPLVMNQFIYHNLVVASFTSDLTELEWCTVIGGKYSENFRNMVRLSNGNFALVASALGAFGYTTSNAFQTNFQGLAETGYISDGWIGILSADGSQMPAGTYFGTTEEDDIMLVDEDSNGDIWVFGISAGEIPLVGNVYKNEGSWPFVSKFSPDLSQLLLSTQIGAGQGELHAIFPNAFMVDNCNNIYLSGFSHETVSLEGFDVSPDSFWNVGGMYLASYLPDMQSLTFGTYSGGNHVHSGYSHFDKKGVLYQALCCTPNIPEYYDGVIFYPILAGYDTIPKADDFEGAIFKLDFESPSVVSSFTYDILSLCAPATVAFSNWSDSATYQWNFGTGAGWMPLQDSTVLYTFSEPGNYTVQLVAYDINSCNVWDTMKTIVHIPDFGLMDLSWSIADFDSCGNSSVFSASYTGSGATSYQWIFQGSPILEDEPQLDVDLGDPGIYTIDLIGYEQACNTFDTLSTVVHQGPPVLAGVDILQDATGCVPQELIALSVSENADSLNWLINEVSEGSSSQFEFSFDTPGEFEVTLIATGSTGCDLDDTTSFIITVYDLPLTSFSLPDTLCTNDGPIELNTGVPAGGNYLGPGISGNVFDPVTAGLGTHEITYSFTDTYGCTSSVSEIVLVDNCMGIEDAGTMNSLLIYPNPANTSISFDARQTICSILIWNSVGELVEEVHNEKIQHSFTIAIGRWAEGVYFYEATLGDVSTVQGKFEVIR